MESDQSIFPRRDSVESDAPPSVRSLDSADKVFETLRSTTARNLVTEIYNGPATASDLASAIDTSLQNAHYHLQRLHDAGLIDKVGTWYSEKGKEMTVYGPAADPFVIWAGPEESEAGVRELMHEAEDEVHSRA